MSLRSRILPLAAVVLAACSVPPAAPDPELDADAIDESEGTIFECGEADVCTATGAVYAAAFRLGAAPNTRGELLQVFEAPITAQLGGVSLALRNLRPFTSTQPPHLRIDAYELAPGPAPSIADRSPIAQGSLAITRATTGRVLVDFQAPAPLVAGRRYALHVRADAPDTTGALLVGVAGRTGTGNLNASAWRRGLRRANAGEAFDAPPFRPSAATLAVGLHFADACGTTFCDLAASCVALPTGRTCVCAAGFSGDGASCTDIDECATNHGGCDAAAACANTPGSRTCTCPSGWRGDGLACTEIDECAEESDDCDPNAECANTTGLFTCTCRPGWAPATNGACVDVNECASGNGGCDPRASCTNVDGGRVCGECPQGFTGTGELGCVDVNECATNNGGCFPGVACTNTAGARTCGGCPSGYTGDGVTCTDVNECLGTPGCAAQANCVNAPGSYQCVCQPGWQGNGTTCADVDECATNNGGCGEDGICINSAGSFECTCGTGFQKIGNACRDIDECATNNGGCSAKADCINYAGGSSCECHPGYIGNGVVCQDLDECATAQDDCAADAVCTNAEGSFGCACKPGFDGNGRTCTDRDECALATDDCGAHATCANTPGSFTCTCDPGWTGSGKVCSDRNECVENTDDCSNDANCTNTVGAFSCACKPGFDGDGRTCTDRNECTNGTAQCDARATCQNAPGTFSCVCNPGYSGNGTTCTATTPGSVVLVSGSGQVVARARTTAPLVVRVLSPTSAPMEGYAITFSITAGGGTLDAGQAVSTRSAVSDANGLAQLAYTAGPTAGTATVLATDGQGHTQTFTITVRDYAPTALTAIPKRLGAPTQFEFSLVDATIPPYGGTQTAATAQNTPAALVVETRTPTQAVGTTSTTLPAIATLVGAYDNVGSASESIDVQVTAALAAGSAVASCSTTSASVPGVTGLTCPNFTAAAPTQTFSFARGLLTPGPVVVQAAATDAFAGPLDTYTTTLTATGARVRVVSNLFGSVLSTGSGMLAPYGTNQAYFAANTAAGRSKLFRYTTTSGALQQISNIRGNDFSDSVGNLIVVGADVYFVAAGADTFSKLFKYNGSTITQVSNTRPGASDGVGVLVAFNGGVAFTAADENGFTKLYWTNGSMAQQVPETRPGTSDGITIPRVFQGALFYGASDANGLSRLYRWDGTFGAGAVTAFLSPRGSAYTNAVANLMVYGANLYLSAANPNGATKLHRFDGTTMTQVASLRASTSSDGPTPLAVWNSKLYFYATGSTGYGKLHVYDEAAGLATPVSNTRPGNHDAVNVTMHNSMYFLNFATSATRLFFVAQDANALNKLWQYDGTSVTQIPETNPGDHDNPAYLAVSGNDLFYTSVNAQGLAKVFRWDGMTSVQIADLNPGENDAFVHPKLLGSTLLFFARNAQNAFKLWRVDGAAAPLETPDPTAGSALNRGSDSMAVPVVYGGKLYFSANTARGVTKLHRYDGTTISQVTNTNLQGTSDSVSVPVACMGKLYFQATDRLSFTKLWEHDGTTTRQITDLNTVGSDSIGTPTCFQGKLVFAAVKFNVAALGKLFEYDGTTLRQLADLRTTGSSDGTALLTVFNGALYFRSYMTGVSYYKLFRYDGTSIVQVSNTCSSCSDAIGMTFVGGNYLYMTSVPTGAPGTKLFRYDGTSFQQLTNFNPVGSDSVSQFVYWNGKTYFSGSIDGMTKLYSDDGTTVAQVSDLNPGSFDAPSAPVVYNNRLWLSAYGPQNRAKLFRYDGTDFTQVLDLMGPEQHDSPSALVVYENALYFHAAVDGAGKILRLCEPSAGCTP